VLKESGALGDFAKWCDNNIHNVWVMGLVAGLVSTVLDSFATAMNFFWMCPVAETIDITQSQMPQYKALFATNGTYWKVMAYASAVGGTIMAGGSMSGMAFARMERVKMMSYISNFGLKVLAGGLLGFIALYIIETML